MVGESWKRPSIVLVVWAAALLLVFVVRGDLRVEAPQTAPPAGSVGASSAPAVPSPVVVRPERSQRQERKALRLCRGRVFDATGFLVVGAEVRAQDRDPVRTDADGVFQLEMREGSFTDMLVVASGQRSQWLRASSASPDPLLVQLTPRAPWDDDPAPLQALLDLPVGEGLVRSPGGGPVSGAYVTETGSDLWSRTDEFGRYALPLRTNPATLVVHQADGGEDERGFAARSEPMHLARTRGLVPLPDIVAAKGGSIRGVVRDDRGAPIAGVPVHLRGEGLVRVAETGPGGTFRIAGLQPGTYAVRPFAFRGALGATQQVVLDRSVVECDLHLQSAEERRLRILDERGSPVAHAYVASGFGGMRNCVAKADAEGWAAVRVGEGGASAGWDFEVRTGADHVPVPVRRFEAEQATLVVALP